MRYKMLFKKIPEGSVGILREVRRPRASVDFDPPLGKWTLPCDNLEVEDSAVTTLVQALNEQSG